MLEERASVVHLTRRQTIVAGMAAWQTRAAGSADPDNAMLLRAGGVVVAFRHALAPGTFDPPGFALGNCATQRNLGDDGRAQARRIGAWFKTRHLTPARVRSSPWCRCIDTATLAFGSAQPWAALGSPSGQQPATRASRLQELQQALDLFSKERRGFEVWVTHMFVLADLTGENADSGAGLLLQAGPDGKARVVACLAIR